MTFLNDAANLHLKFLELINKSQGTSKVPPYDDYLNDNAKQQPQKSRQKIIIILFFGLEHFNYLITLVYNDWWSNDRISIGPIMSQLLF